MYAVVMYAVVVGENYVSQVQRSITNDADVDLRAA
jgi:hypothetical protein